jgi:hypothetical protein
VDVDELLAYNKMKKNVRLSIGDKVLVPVKEGDQDKPAGRAPDKNSKKNRR